QTNDIEGVLARRRKMDDLNEELLSATSALTDAELAVSDAETTLTMAQQEDFELSTTIAQLQGESDSLREEVGRLEQTITSGLGERSDIERQLADIAARNLASQPLIGEMEQRIATINADIAALEETIAAGSDERLARMNEEASLRDSISKCNVDIATSSTREVFLKQRIAVLEDEVKRLEKSIKVSQETQISLDILSHRVDPLYDSFKELSDGIKVWANKLRDQAQLEQSNSSSLMETIGDAREAVRVAKEELDAKLAKVADLRVDKGKIEIQVDSAIKSIVQENHILIEKALEVPPIEDRVAAEARELKLRRKIDNIGLVNQVAMEEYEALRRRRDHIAAQIDDLNAARKSLAKIVNAIDRKMRNRFLETFEQVDASFQEIFEQLFPGGSAHLELTNPDDPETTGVEIYAQPLGKKITKTTLMSGGEKSLTALALLFAIYRTRTVPFYVLDEVDDALDDTNLRRLVSYLDSVRGKQQFLLVTHARRTMEMADVLYGVSMQADGVSKVVSQKLERAIAQDASDATPEDLQAAIDADALTVRPAATKGRRGLGRLGRR
ncbi:MAG: chromosome segregation protein SMC, partial [Coriobacteriales bacterium]|nr:chromosome segregation protein SMC [Coriobacteriales bacterium]